MDQSLWQTSESIDFLHSSYMWLQTILSCGKHCNTMQIGIVSRLLRIQNLHQVEHCAFSEAIRSFQSVGCARNKLQFCKSSRESEIILLDAGLRMDGIPALDLLDLIVTVLHENTHQNDQVRGDPKKSPTRKKIHGKIDDPNNVDLFLKLEFFSLGSFVVHLWRQRSSDQDDQTKGNLARDEWNHLRCFFNISHISSINSLEAMSKRTQEDVGEEGVTAKSKSMMNLVSRYRVRCPNVLASTASETPGKTKSESQNVPLSSLNVQQTSTGETRIGR